MNKTATRSPAAKRTTQREAERELRFQRASVQRRCCPTTLLPDDGTGSQGVGAPESAVAPSVTSTCEPSAPTLTIREAGATFSLQTVNR